MLASADVALSEDVAVSAGSEAAVSVSNGAESTGAIETPADEASGAVEGIPDQAGEDQDTDTPAEEVEYTAPLQRESAVDLVVTGPEAKKEYAAVFTEKEIRYSGGHFEDELFKYRLYEPELKEGQASYPMLVWLHGAGDSGRDNVRHLRWLGSIMRLSPDRLKRLGLYFLAVQSPREQPGWKLASREAPVSPEDPAHGDILSVLKVVIDRTVAEYPIDANRISLSGISSGGTACWEMGVRYPSLFSVLVPLSSAGADNSRVHRLKDVPVWAFHNKIDDRIDIAGVRRTVAVLNEAGGSAYLTEQPQMGHIVFAFKYDKLLEWVLAQDRSKTRWRVAPGSFDPKTYGKEEPSWQIHQLGLQFGLPVLLVLAVYFEIKRRRNDDKAAEGLDDSAADLPAV